MSIGDTPIHPTDPKQNAVGDHGMTYRQWLVGQILAGSRWPDWDGSGNEDGWIADRAVALADAVIARLERNDGAPEEKR